MIILGSLEIIRFTLTPSDGSGKSVEQSTTRSETYVNLLHNGPFNTADDKVNCVHSQTSGGHVPQCPMPGDATVEYDSIIVLN